jgi:hypothetical protein
MAASPVLIGALVPVFHEVHSGSFVLLTNAVTNSATWPAALHTKLALEAGVTADDVQAIRARRPPRDARLAALSGLARAMIEKRGHLEVIVAASTITNYTASVTKPALEAVLQPHAWSV